MLLDLAHFYTSHVCVCVCIMCEEWVYEAQIEVLNRNNAGSSFSLNPRLLCVWLLPTWIAEEVHVNSMADLTAAQPWWVRSPGTVEQKWWHFLVFLLFRGWRGTKGAYFPLLSWHMQGWAHQAVVAQLLPQSFIRGPRCFHSQGNVTDLCHWWGTWGGHRPSHWQWWRSQSPQTCLSCPCGNAHAPVCSGNSLGLIPLQTRSAVNDAACTGHGGK